MVTSTDAKLVWGFTVDDDLEKELCELYMDERFTELALAERRTGGSLVYHCSDECVEYIVGLESTVVVAYRGYPEEITSLDLPPDAQEKLDAFARALRISPKPGKWLLASWWG